MPARRLRLAFLILAVLAGLLLPLAPARAQPARHISDVTSAPEGFVERLWSWLADLGTASLGKNGSTTDPNGRPAPSGGGQTGAHVPVGGPENGSTTDPDG